MKTNQNIQIDKIGKLLMRGIKKFFALRMADDRADRLQVGKVKDCPGFQTACYAKYQRHFPDLYTMTPYCSGN